MDQVDAATLASFTISAGVLCVVTVVSLFWAASASPRMPRPVRALSLLSLALWAVLAVRTLAVLPLLAEALVTEAGDAATLYSLPLDLAPLLPHGTAVTMTPGQLVWPQLLGLMIGLVLYAIGAIGTPRETPKAAPRKARLPMAKRH